MRFILVVLLLIITFSLKATELSIVVDSTGHADCCVKGAFHGRLLVQQFRWNKWVTMYSIESYRQWNDTCFRYPVELHSGQNQFRLASAPTNPYIDAVYSAIAKIGEERIVLGNLRSAGYAGEERNLCSDSCWRFAEGRLFRQLR